MIVVALVMVAVAVVSDGLIEAVAAAAENHQSLTLYQWDAADHIRLRR
jgi:hypothetical protein